MRRKKLQNMFLFFYKVYYTYSVVFIFGGNDMLRSIEQIKSLATKTKDDKAFYDKFSNLYGVGSKIEAEAYERLANAADNFKACFGKDEGYIFSASGRTEMVGNHTDHNNGCVLTASINLDKLAIVNKRDDNKIIIYTDSKDNHDEIDVSDVSFVQTEKGGSKALIRGVAAKFKEKGYSIGGFEAFVNNRVLIGSGLSSSASFEVLVGHVFNVLYNDSKIEPLELAIIGQYAENVYFGKPCGLMDQVGCAVGGIVSIDFADNDNPIVEKVEYDFYSNGYSMIVVDTKGDHANLTDEYGAIRSEMNSVATHFGKTVCREIKESDVFENVSKLRHTVGDRAILRAMHFFGDNERVAQQIEALKSNNIKEYIRHTNESGQSSFMYLQNTYSVTSTKNMGVALAYMLSYKFFGSDGAIRVHGGGFAGTVLAIVPNDKVEAYSRYMDDVFGQGSSVVLHIRQSPVCCL